MPAAVLADAIIRLIPGVLSDESSALLDSFQGELLDAPVYTRPADFRGMKVPDVLMSGDFAKKAFALSPTNEPFAGPLVGDEAVYVIALDKRIPSEIPPLEQIRDRVTADYKYDQARTLARQAGQELHVTLTNGLAAGKAFSNICAEAKVQPTNLPPFSLSRKE